VSRTLLPNSEENLSVSNNYGETPTKGQKKWATTYSPTGRPRSTIGAGGLNFSVRNGKRCIPAAIVTLNKKDIFSCKPQGDRSPIPENCIGEKPSSPRLISTTRLNTSPCLHLWPINLVVYQESYSLMGMGDLISRRASRLDAFSGYPFRT
jgi:hypothetical protein